MAVAPIYTKCESACEVFFVKTPETYQNIKIQVQNKLASHDLKDKHR